jgi:membrane protease YdiL (CAAX protease family)
LSAAATLRKYSIVIAEQLACYSPIVNSLFSHPRFAITAAVALLLNTWLGASAEEIVYRPVSRDLGNDKQRKATL